MTEARPSELLVIAASKPWSCADCEIEFERGEFLTMDDAGPFCLSCADLGHLAFLPRGEAALTRRARRASRLSAVVVQWSRSRKRYERQGVLAEPDAIVQAEQECLADGEVRERRRERDAQRRAVEDERFVADLAAAVRAQFPDCPRARALRIAGHAGARSSGRIGRTSAGRALDPDAVQLAVVAAVRHEDTRYEDLLMSGVARAEARDLFDVGIGSPIAAGSVRLSVTASIGTTGWAHFHVDLVGPDLQMTGQPDDVPPLARGVIPDVEQHGYRAYPLVDHIADKVAAMYERHGAGRRLWFGEHCSPNQEHRARLHDHLVAISR